MEEWRRERGVAGCPLWPAANEWRGRDFGEGEMEREGVGCQMKDFSPILILYTSTSYKEIMPSAP